jgi:purine-nucleoside/S-methyl-5'-thioadenosine phosphorylase / adenosine deaminase
MTTLVAAGFRWMECPAGRVLRNDRLKAHAPHFVTTRELEFRGETIAADFDRVGAVFGCAGRDVYRVRQVHGRVVHVVSPESHPEETPQADAIVSTDPRRPITVRVADCVPILLADHHRRVVAAVHAGWRGTVAGVAMATVETIAALGIPAEDLLGVVGPSMGPCCYQVDVPVREAFLNRQPQSLAFFKEDGPDHWKLDLWAANVAQLVSAGVSREAIEVAGVCTAENLDVCFSHRAEGASTGRLLAAIKLKLK